VQLDFWGLDLGYISTADDFVFFEGNAAMSILFTPRSGANARPPAKSLLASKRAKISAGLRQKLKMHIENPDLWVRQ
jgi:hypothetical protein